MAASVRNVVWTFSRIRLAELCLRQSPRMASSKASGTAESTAKPAEKKATKQEPTPEEPKPTPSESPAPSDTSTYSYQVPRYDDQLFYNLESDMTKFRLPQPAPGKP